MEITQPTLVLSKTRCVQNIELMAEKAKRHNLSFRPHFKTHQSAEIGSWFRMVGVDRITVSSVNMARYFYENGWKNITIAIPFNILEVDRLNEFSNDCILNLIVDNKDTIEIIGNKSKSEIGIFIKITTGYQRSGVENMAITKIEELIQTILKFKNLQFKGFLTHAGHTYFAATKYEIQNIHYDALKKINFLKVYFSPDFPDIEISIGDTPSCSISENFKGVTEIRPGNFVFYDLKQNSIGACRIDDIALSMYCPVISKQPIRNEVVVYGGAIHFSKDCIRNTDGKDLYGRVIIKKGTERTLLDTSNYLCRLTQEHGIVRLNPSVFRQLNIGDVIEIIPVHACLAAFSMGRYFTTKGEVIDMMPRF